MPPSVLVAENRIAELPGFIGKEFAINTDDRRKAAFDIFEQTAAEDLPVIDREGPYVGALNRGTFVSEILARFCEPRMLRDEYKANGTHVAPP